MAKATKIEDDAGTQPEEIMPGVIRGIGAAPRPERLRRRAVKGPSRDQILDLCRGDWLLVKVDELGISENTIRSRVTQANSKLVSGERYHYESYETAPGRVVIECCDGPPKRRSR